MFLLLLAEMESEREGRGKDRKAGNVVGLGAHLCIE